MPDEPISASAASESSEPEWTDDSNYQVSDVTSPDSEITIIEEATDEWEAASLDWEEEYIETSTPQPAPTTTKEALSWLTPLWRKLKSSWQRILVGLRSRIPAAAELSDSAITAILIGILVVLLLVLNGVRQPSVASEKGLKSEGAESVPADVPTDSAAVQSPSAPTPTGPSAESSIEEKVSVKATGDRIPELQRQLTDSDIPNAQRVIESLQADFTADRLTLILNSDWFRLSEYEQITLASQLLAQSKKLTFADIEFRTSENALIARAPVVGNDMIIFLREKPPQVDPPERPRYRIMIDR